MGSLRSSTVVSRAGEEEEDDEDEEALMLGERLREELVSEPSLSRSMSWSR